MVLSPTQSSDSGTQSMIAEMSVSRSPIIESHSVTELSGSKSSGKKRQKIIYIDMTDSSSSSEDDSLDSIIIDNKRRRDKKSSDENFSEAYLSSSYDEMEPSFKRRKSGGKPLRFSDSDSDSGEEDAVSLDDDEYNVDKILDVKTKHGKKFFHVKWLNYDSSENTWEPEENLSNCREVIEEFYRNRVSSSAKRYISSRSKLKGQKRSRPAPKGRSKRRPLRKNPTRRISNDVKEKSMPKLSHYQRGDDYVTSTTSSSSPSSFPSLSSPIPSPVSPSSGSSSTAPLSLPSPVSPSSSSSSPVPPSSPSSNSPSPSSSPVPQRFPFLEQEYCQYWYVNLDELPPAPTQELIPKHLQNHHLFHFRVVSDERVGYTALNLLERFRATEPEQYYECILTEDLAGKNIKFLYGATQSFSGDVLCPVLFEECSYVDVVPAEVLLNRFPYVRKYYEIVCPQLFPRGS